MKRAWVATIAVGVMLISLATWMLYLNHMTYSLYGDHPSIGYHNPDLPRDCTRIYSVQPKVNWNIWGKIWEDEGIPWTDIVVESPPGTPIPQNNTGFVTPGDRVCGLDDWFVFRYLPTGRIIGGSTPRHWW